jgi:hypothetical protein
VTWTILVLVVLAVVLWTFYVSWRASRLDRLHNRVEAARAALEVALVRRGSAASELASSGVLDPATSLVLADAALRARQAGAAERDLAESDLTRTLRVILDKTALAEAGLAEAGLAEAGLDKDDPADLDGAGELVEQVERAARQLFIARKFYNDVAGRTIDDRGRFLVRTLHLYGTAKQPEFFDMDDEL